VVNCEYFVPGGTSLAHLVSLLVTVGSTKLGPNCRLDTLCYHSSPQTGATEEEVPHFLLLLV
jgi:hypothetical protein